MIEAEAADLAVLHANPIAKLSTKLCIPKRDGGQGLQPNAAVSRAFVEGARLAAEGNRGWARGRDPLATSPAPKRPRARF
jgi:hypothetical protein